MCDYCTEQMVFEIIKSGASNKKLDYNFADDGNVKRMVLKMVTDASDKGGNYQ